MKKDEKFIIFVVILLIIGCFFMSGCSLIKPIISAVTPSITTVPIDTEKSNNTIRCKGEIKVNVDGSYTCSDQFYSKDVGTSIKERKLTFKEKIVQFVNKFFGLSVILCVILVIVSPATLLYIMSIIVNKYKKALKQVVSGVQKARKQNVDLNIALASEQDSDVKRVIQEIKNKNNI